MQNTVKKAYKYLVHAFMSHSYSDSSILLPFVVEKTLKTKHKRTIDVVGSNGVDTNRNMYLLILSMCQVMRIACGNGGN